MRQLALQFVTDISQALEIFHCPLDAALGLLAPLLVFGDTGGFFDEDAQLFRLRFNQPGHHALLNDRVATGTQTGAEEDVSDVLAAALGAIEEIGRLSIAIHAALDGHFGEIGVFASQAMVLIVEHQLHAGLAHRLAGAGAIENDVCHVLATQVLGRAFPHHPAHSVDDIGFTAAVGPDNRAEVGGKIDGSRVYKGLKARKLDAFQPHEGNSDSSAG